MQSHIRTVTVQEMASRITSVHVKIKDLNVTMDDIIPLTLLNNSGREWSQYRTVLTVRARETESLGFDSVVKGLEDRERTMRNDTAANRIKRPANRRNGIKTPTSGTSGTSGIPSTPLLLLR